ncbi:hypothetical protein O9992_27255 [Vibrio lentus]|nr:hypothetical protein [Vibrio lentus]
MPTNKAARYTGGLFGW